MLVFMVAYLLLCLGDQVLRKQGNHMEGCSSDGTSGILFYIYFQIVHIAVSASKREVGHIDENTLR